MSIADRRFQFTEKVIRETYLEMLAEMPAHKISVTDLCKRADLNRSTFYLHYQDCVALLDALGSELADRICARISDMFRDDQAMQQNMIAMMKPDFFSNPDDWNIFMSEGAHCSEKIVARAKDVTTASWLGRSNLTKDQIHMLFTYVAYGGLAVTKAARVGELQLNDTEDYHMLYQLISQGLHSLVERLPYKHK